MTVSLFRNIKTENWFSMERYAQALAAELRTNSHELTIKEFSFSVPDFLFRGRRKFFWRFGAYPFLVRFFQGDVNHIVDHSYARAIKYLDKKKTIITCHDLIPLEYEKDSQALEIFKKTISYLPQAAKIIAVSKATKKDIVEKLKVPEEKVVVVYEGVGEKFKVQTQNQFQTQIQVHNQIHMGKKIILNVGNSLEYKNINGLLRAFSKVREEKKDVVLVKVGKFTKEQLELSLKLDLNLSLDIIELTNVSDEELVNLYNSATVTCMPSHKEGFGFPVLESMACGTPVVCSNTSSLPEIGGSAAIYCDPNSPSDIAKKLLQVLSFDNSNYQRIVEKGLKQAAEFSWEKCAKETLKIYQTITE